MNDPLSGTPVRVSQSMTGVKTAVMLNGEIIVSPAMWSLMSNSNQEELKSLLDSIEIMDMGTFNPLGGLGMPQFKQDDSNYGQAKVYEAFYYGK